MQRCIIQNYLFSISSTLTPFSIAGKDAFWFLHQVAPVFFFCFFFEQARWLVMRFHQNSLLDQCWISLNMAPAKLLWLWGQDKFSNKDKIWKNLFLVGWFFVMFIYLFVCFCVMIIAVKTTFYTGVYRFGVFSCKKIKWSKKRFGLLYWCFEKEIKRLQRKGGCIKLMK